MFPPDEGLLALGYPVEFRQNGPHQFFQSIGWEPQACAGPIQCWQPRRPQPTKNGRSGSSFRAGARIETAPQGSRIGPGSDPGRCARRQWRVFRSCKASNFWVGFNPTIIAPLKIRWIVRPPHLRFSFDQSNIVFGGQCLVEVTKIIFDIDSTLVIF